MAASGHDGGSDRGGLSAGCGFSEETFPGIRRNEEDAPIPAVGPRLPGFVFASDSSYSISSGNLE
jgi:hypothetical protein